MTKQKKKQKQKHYLRFRINTGKMIYSHNALKKKKKTENKERE